MTQLEKLLQKREKERLKKEEIERKIAEKKAEKERLKKIKHKKMLKKKQNRRAYVKRRAVQLEERKKNNDKYAYYMVVIMKNKRRIKRIGTTWWKNDALEMYNNAIEENKSSVLCPVEIYETADGRPINGSSTIDMKFEIMLVEKVGKDEEKVKKFRNEDGKLIDNVIVDSDYKIVAKHDWLVEEKFSVYGYHPKKQRKDAHFVLNEMLLKDYGRDNTKRVFIYKNKLVIQYDSDFDFVTCKTEGEAERLYDILEKAVKKDKKNKFILFTDKLSRGMSTWIINELEKKTGWRRESCKRIHVL
jgi:hypothetical protein